MIKLHNMLVVALLVAGLLCAGCFKSKNVVKKIPPGDGTLTELNGVTYFLPRTVVQVRVPFKKKDKSPGEFSRYAPCFFSKEVAAGRVKVKSTAFSTGQPTFSSRGERDPEERYIAKIKGGFFENKTMLLEFNPDGVITKGEASSTNTAIDVAIKAARTAVSIGATAFRGPASAAPTNTARAAAERAALDRAELDICRATVVAEAARAAAESAVEAAKASGNPAEPNAVGARDRAEVIDQNVEAARAELKAVTQAFNDTAFAPAALSNLLYDLRVRTNDLIDEVVCDAKYVASAVLLAAAAARPSAANEADAAQKAAGEIQPAITFIGKRDAPAPPATAAMPAPAPPQARNRAGCAAQVDVPLQTLAFAGGYAAAKERHHRIIELKSKRENLASGETAPQGVTAEGLQKMLEETDRAISTYENTFFLGTEDEDNWSGDFEFTPGRSLVSTSYNTWQSSPVLLLFSKSKGLCETPETSQQGVKIKPTFKAAQCAPAPGDTRALWLSVSRVTVDDAYFGHLAAANARDERRGDRGFYYRVPAKAVVKLESGSLTSAQLIALDEQSRRGREWRPYEQAPPAAPVFVPTGSVLAQENRMRVAQLGVTASLPASAAGRTTQYTIEFDEATGAIRVFKLGSNALLEASVVDEIGGAAGDVLAAKQVRDKAKAEAADPVNQKKRELELLKLENDIETEKKKRAASQQGAQQP